MLSPLACCVIALMQSHPALWCNAPSSPGRADDEETGGELHVCGFPWPATSILTRGPPARIPHPVISHFMGCSAAGAAYQRPASERLIFLFAAHQPH